MKQINTQKECLVRETYFWKSKAIPNILSQLKHFATTKNAIFKSNGKNIHATYTRQEEADNKEVSVCAHVCMCVCMYERVIHSVEKK